MVATMECAKRLSFGDVTLRSAELPGGVGDVLKAAADPTGEALHRALEEVCNSNERFERVRSVAAEQAEGNGEGDAARLRAHFQSLKTNYLQLQAKDGFIKSLISMSFPDEQKCKQLEVITSVAKNELKATKEVNEDTEKQITELISKISNIYDTFLAERSMLAQQLEEIISTEAAVAEVEKEDEDGATLEEYEAMIAKYTDECEQMTAEAQHYQDEKTRLQREAGVASLRISSLTTEAEQLAAKGEQKEAALTEANRTKAAGEWCNSMTEFLCSLSGVKVVSVSDESIIVSLHTQVLSLELTIDIYPASGTIKGLTVEPQTINVSDIAAAVKDSRNFQAAVLETKALMLGQ